MDTRDLAKIDLNLLISLQVLLEERSVSRAAERLYITQPAMSKTLSRLRTLCDDALFTRSSHGMQPTPRALQLADGLSRVLGDISHLLAGPRLDPSSFTGEVTLALSEFIGVAFLPALMEQLSRQAPLLSVRVITRIENQLEELALGNLDFAIQVKQAQYGPDFRVGDVGDSPLAVLVRQDHPLVQREITWDHLFSYPLIKLYATHQEQLEIQQSTASKIPVADRPMGSLEISHLLTALEVLRQSNYFMLAPAYFLQQAEATAGITGLQLPQGAEINIGYSLVAHQRTANSPTHNWLWDQITCTIRALHTPMQRKMRQRITAGTTGSLH